jgi:hypothetical protein
MKSPETNIKAKELWENLPVDIRVKLLGYFQFWDGLSTYLYEYLPEDVKNILRFKIVKNYPYWL